MNLMTEGIICEVVVWKKKEKEKKMVQSGEQGADSDNNYILSEHPTGVSDGGQSFLRMGLCVRFKR